LLTIKDINIQIANRSSYYTRVINNYSLEECKTGLSYEYWDSIFNNNDNNDVDSLFNRFMNNNLRVVHTSFPLRKVRERSKSNQWITTGIKTSCIHKRQLYLLSKNSNDVILIKYCKQYCRVLTRVITEAKKSTYNKQITNYKQNENLEHYKIRNKQNERSHS
jgi:hypothetical protein